MIAGQPICLGYYINVRCSCNKTCLENSQIPLRYRMEFSQSTINELTINPLLIREAFTHLDLVLPKNCKGNGSVSSAKGEI